MRRGGGNDRYFFVNFLSEAVVPRSTHSRVDQEDLSVRPFCVGSHAFQIEIWINVVVDEDLPFGPDFLGKIGCSGLFVNRINYERSEEHTSELQSLMRISYAVFCLKKKTKQTIKRSYIT